MRKASETSSIVEATILEINLGLSRKRKKSEFISRVCRRNKVSEHFIRKVAGYDRMREIRSDLEESK